MPSKGLVQVQFKKKVFTRENNKGAEKEQKEEVLKNGRTKQTASGEEKPIRDSSLR